MGIKDINSFLSKTFDAKGNPFEQSDSTSKLSGYRIAIDACNWIYTYLSTAFKKELEQDSFDIDQAVNLDRVFNFLLYDLYNFIKLLLDKNITPVFVWDGEHPQEKSKTKAKRISDRLKKIEETKLLLEEIRQENKLFRDSDKIKLWKRNYCSFARLEERHFSYLKEFIISAGIPSLQASSDAEKLCVELNLAGIVIGVWSRDTDLYALGVQTMILGISEYNFTYIQVCDILDSLEMTQSEFRDFCIGCGCDFNERVRMLGPITLYKKLQKHKFKLEKACRDIDYECLDLERCRDLFTPNLENVKQYQDDPSKVNVSLEFLEANLEIFLTKIGVDIKLKRTLRNLVLGLQPPSNYF